MDKKETASVWSVSDQLALFMQDIPDNHTPVTHCFCLQALSTKFPLREKLKKSHLLTMSETSSDIAIFPDLEEEMTEEEILVFAFHVH